MTLLRRGITGFDVHASVDFTAFKKAAYVAARSAGATIIGSDVCQGVTPNFHRVDLEVGDHRLSMLCNATFPIVAFVKYPPSIDALQPVDFPEFADPMRSLGFEIAAASELNRPIETVDLQLLSDSERRQADYWKPKRISQVVFNWWD